MYSQEQFEEAFTDMEKIFISLDAVHETFLELSTALEEELSDDVVRGLASQITGNLAYTFALGEIAEEKLEHYCHEN